VGKFGQDELDAHRKAAELLGRHRAYAEAHSALQRLKAAAKVPSEGQPVTAIEQIGGRYYAQFRIGNQTFTLANFEPEKHLVKETAEHQVRMMQKAFGRLNVVDPAHMERFEAAVSALTHNEGEDHALIVLERLVSDMPEGKSVRDLIPSLSVDGGWISDDIEIERMVIKMVPTHMAIECEPGSWMEGANQALRYYRDHILKASPPQEPEQP
jgi:hypothetical protein